MSDQLKVMVLNAQDLFLFTDKIELYLDQNSISPSSIDSLTEIQWQLMSSSFYPNKSKEKTLLLGQIMLKEKPDIIMLSEVGGQESLHNFSLLALNNQYTPHTLCSNSDRGIDLGYLVTKNLHHKTHLQSYRHYPIGKKGEKFSRDVLRLDLKNHQGKIKIIFLLAHLKSKRPSRSKDFEGRSQREKEISGLITIYNRLRKKYPSTPIIIGGDMNGHASSIDTEEEFKVLYEKTDLLDTSLIAPLPIEKRWSYIYFDRGGNRFLQQLDYLFIGKAFEQFIIKDTVNYLRYKTSNDEDFILPTKPSQKNIFPSDHCPLVATLKFPPSF